MISAVDIVPGQSGRLILKASNSLSLQGSVGLFISILAVSLAISCAFLAAGAWLITPFILLELLALFAALYYVKRQLDCMEVISIDSDRVLVERGCGRAENSWVFERKQARVLIELADEPLDCYNISLSGQQGMLLLGEALSQSDCDELVDSLKVCGLVVNVPGNAVFFSA